MENKIIKDLKKSINLLIPAEELLIFFWIAYVLGFFVSDWISSRMMFITWFLLTGNVVSYYSKRLQLYIRKKADE